MNKNTIIGSILIAIVMIWWMSSNSSNAQKEAAAQEAARKEAAALEAAKAEGDDPLELGSEAPETESDVVLGDAAAAPAAPVDSAVAAADSSAADSTKAVKPVEILPRTVVVETEKFVMTLSNKGGKVQSVVVKALADSAGNFPELIQDTTLGALDLKLGKADLSKALFAVDAPEKIVVESDTTVQFVFTAVNGKKVIRDYKFTKDGVSVRQSNRFEGFKPTDYELSWKGGMRETEAIPQGKSFGGASYFFSEVIYNNSLNVEREMVRGEETLNEEEGKLRWAGLRRKYVAMAVQYDATVPATLNAKAVGVNGESKDPGTYSIALKDNIRNDSLAYSFMVLPLQWSQLETLGVDYEKVIVSGWTWCGANVWFVWICKMLLKLLNLLYSVIPNYGVAIILVTLIVRGITTPFTVKQMKSTSAMSKLKPQLDEINTKYRTDPQKKQAAIMELYSKNGINPLASCTGGCLPMLIQMPIFMGLFFVLGRALELRGMPAFLWISDLSRSDVVFSGFSIPYLMPDGLALLPLIMVLTTYFQTKVTMGANAGMDPSQSKMMVWMMPAMMFLFSAVMPSGLVLYWIISNIWSIVQYKVIRRDQNGSGPKIVKGKKVVDAEIVK